MVFFGQASARSFATVYVFEWLLAGTAAAMTPMPWPGIPYIHKTNTHMNKTPLGEFIRERRTALGLSQRKLAQRIGLKAPSHLCDVENGFRQIGEEFLPKLAEALEVSLVDLQDHDPRAPFTQAQELFEKDPKYIVALHRVVREAKNRNWSPEEIMRRIEPTTPATDKMTTDNQTPTAGNT
jgi:transcriptional regulator with XRE-family HTH domain